MVQATTPSTVVIVKRDAMAEMPPESALPLSDDADDSVWDKSDDGSIWDASNIEDSGSFRARRRASDASSLGGAILASASHPPSGLSPVISSFIVINYISAGYILLPWGAYHGTWKYLL